MAVETKEQIFLLLDQSDEKLKKFGVKRCGLFGSFLRDRQNLQSDIDLLVEFEMGKKTSPLKVSPDVTSEVAARRSRLTRGSDICDFKVGYLHGLSGQSDRGGDFRGR